MRTIGPATTDHDLGVAYRSKKLESQARAKFQAVLEIWPISEYARRPQGSLKKKGAGQLGNPEAISSQRSAWCYRCQAPLR